MIGVVSNPTPEREGDRGLLDLAEEAKSVHKRDESAFPETAKSPQISIRVSEPSGRVPFASHCFRERSAIICRSVIF
jgi:hypothetical protein